MSKSNRNNNDRLKDSCRRERIRSDRHFAKQLLRNGEYEEVEEMEEEITEREDEKK